MVTWLNRSSRVTRAAGTVGTAIVATWKVGVFDPCLSECQTANEITARTSTRPSRQLSHRVATLEEPSRGEPGTLVWSSGRSGVDGPASFDGLELLAGSVISVFMIICVSAMIHHGCRG